MIRHRPAWAAVLAAALGAAVLAGCNEPVEGTGTAPSGSAPGAGTAAAAKAQAGRNGTSHTKEHILRVTLNRVTQEGVTESIGHVTFATSPYGVVISPSLRGPEPGVHGFHIHRNPDCGAKAKADGPTVPGGAAGGHYDPAGTDAHRGPYREGHLGDLPALVFDRKGEAKLAVLAPRLELSDLRGRSLVLHAEADNYSDSPEPNGGSGARLACGVVQAR